MSRGCPAEVSRSRYTFLQGAAHHKASPKSTGRNKHASNRLVADMMRNAGAKVTPQVAIFRRPTDDCQILIYMHFQSIVSYDCTLIFER